MRIGQVFIAAAKNWLATPSSMATEDLAGGTLQHLSALSNNVLETCSSVQNFSKSRPFIDSFLTFINHKKVP